MARTRLFGGGASTHLFAADGELPTSISVYIFGKYAKPDGKEDEKFLYDMELKGSEKEEVLKTAEQVKSKIGSEQGKGMFAESIVHAKDELLSVPTS